MNKLDIVFIVVCAIGLMLSLFGVGEAKWMNNIDLLYNRFIAVMFFYGALVAIIKKKQE